MSHKPTLETKLKRFLYLSTENSTFVSGDPETHSYYKPEKLTCATQLLKDDVTKSKGFLTNLFVSVENETLLPRREPLFFALACLVTNESATADQRHSFYTMVLNMCRNNEDLFTFIKFVSKIKKPCSSGLQKIVSLYYLRQEPLDLIKCISESNSYHGWSHKDLIKLIHSKIDNQAMEVIIKYILYGEAKAAEAVGEDETSLKVIECIRKVKEYRTCNDENKVAQLIPELNIKHARQLPPALLKSQTVWAALIPRLSLSELLVSLPKLCKTGLLKGGPVQAKVVEILSNNELIKSSNIHPVEVYIGLKNLSKGGKPKDPHLVKYLEMKEDVDAKILADPDYKKPNFAHREPCKCTPVLNVLQKALSTSYSNLKPVSKRILVAIDTNDRMNEPCLTTKNVTCIEAAVFMAYCLHRANRNVAITVFGNNRVVPLSLNQHRHLTLAELYGKVKEVTPTTASWSAPFDYALEVREKFDVFLFISTRPHVVVVRESGDKDKPKEAFSNYMKKMNVPHARIISCSLGYHNACFSDGATNILDVCGFDKNVPKIIDAFCKNLF